MPSDIPFVDENGKDVTLGDYFGKRPVVLALVYYECPMLCTQVLNGLVSALGVLNFEAGPGVRRRRGQLQPEGRPWSGVTEEGRLPRTIRTAPVRRGLAFPDRIAGLDRSADRRRRFPL